MVNRREFCTSSRFAPSKRTPSFFTAKNLKPRPFLAQAPSPWSADPCPEPSAYRCFTISGQSSAGEQPERLRDAVDRFSEPHCGCLRPPLLLPFAHSQPTHSAEPDDGLPWVCGLAPQHPSKDLPKVGVRFSISLNRPNSESGLTTTHSSHVSLNRPPSPIFTEYPGGNVSSVACPSPCRHYRRFLVGK
jgi:hypothetical protein